MNKEEELKYYQEAYKREKQARKEAEKILEVKALELFQANQALKELNLGLEAKLEDRIKELRLNEERFEEFVRSASDVIYTTTPDGRFSMVNEKALKVTEYDANELLGKHFYDLVDYPSKREMISFYQRQVKNNTASTYFEFRIRTKNGKYVWLGQNVQLLKENGNLIGYQAIARDITDKKEALDLLQQSEEKYRSLLENMKLGILEVSRDGKIVKAYDKFCELTGYSKEELIGQDPNELFLDEPSRKIISEQENNRKFGLASVYEVQMYKKDGSPLWVLISGAPFYDSKGHLEGTMGIHLDITERKKMELDLQKAERQATDSSKAKELFLANMSHEIRTPLNAVIGLSQLLDKTDLNQQQSEYVDTIKESAGNLLSLVNNILDFSKIESGQFELNFEAVNVHELLNNVHQTLSYFAFSKDLDFSFESNLDPKAHYKTDKLRLTQVFLNLLNNAIKFTPSGSVVLSAQIVSTNSLEHNIRFEVSDTGVGIAKNEQQQIFNDFKQASIQDELNAGTGLGLSICKKIVALLGGDLVIESELGKGSKFFFEVPLEIVEADTSQHRIEPRVENWANFKVLLAEDNRVNQFVASGLIESWGATLDICENGLEVLERIKESNYDIILMDIQMPQMDGTECTRHIRQVLKLDIPIIALTANAVKGDKERFLEAGMNEYVSKPFSEFELKSKMNKILGQADNISVKNPESLESLLDTRKLENLSKGNPEFIQRMLSVFVSESAELIVQMENATNTAEISRLAHKIKPSIDYLASQDLRNQVRQIEAEAFVEKPEILSEFIKEWKRLNLEVLSALQR